MPVWEMMANFGVGQHPKITPILKYNQQNRLDTLEDDHLPGICTTYTIGSRP